MKKFIVKNIEEVLGKLTFDLEPSFDTKYRFVQGLSGTWINHQTGNIQCYIVDETGFNHRSGKNSVLGLEIHFHNQKATLSVHRKGTGWNPTHKILIADRANFTTEFRSSDSFVKLLHAHIRSLISRGYY